MKLLEGGGDVERQVVHRGNKKKTAEVRRSSGKVTGEESICREIFGRGKA